MHTLEVMAPCLIKFSFKVWRRCLYGKHILMLARAVETDDTSEGTRIEMRERAWIWYKTEYERVKELAPFTLTRIRNTTYPVSQAAMRNIDNYTR